MSTLRKRERTGAGLAAGSVLLVGGSVAASSLLDGYPILMPERVSFYGMREIGVSEPGGHSVIFAART